MRSAGRSFGGLNPGPRLLRDYSDAAGIELSLKVSSEFVQLTGLRSHSPCASKSGVSIWGRRVPGGHFSGCRELGDHHQPARRFRDALFEGLQVRRRRWRGFGTG